MIGKLEIKRLSQGLLLFFFLGGWTLYPPGQFSKPIAQVVGSGGLCPSKDGSGAVCYSVITSVFENGQCLGSCKRAHMTDKDIDVLKTVIANADYNALRQKKPGVCPSAGDGQDIIYVFHTPKGEERLNTCEYAIDKNKEPFKTFQGIMEKN